MSSSTAQKTIVATGSIDQPSIDILSPHGQYRQVPDDQAATLLSMMPDAVGLVVRGAWQITEQVMAAAPHLKVIGRTGVGYDNVDIAAATARKIPVIYTPGAGARAVAEASMAMMLTLTKQLRYWDEQLKAGNWASRNRMVAGDMDGATLGIIGFGRIGQTLASLAGPFQMNVLAHDPAMPRDAAGDLGVQLVDLVELISRADFICLHALLTADNRGLINRDLLKHAKRGAYLVNLARGGLIESLDVLDEALEDGTLAGVGLDVFDPEPPDVSHPIFKRDNCLTAPHALGMTPGAMGRIYKSMALDMAAVLSGGEPKFVVNPETLA